MQQNINNITFLFTLFAVVLTSNSFSTPECPVVQCNNGKVSGVVKKANHDDAKFVFNYNAIPFAEPPLGELRFKRTTALKRKWEGILDGSTSKNSPLANNIIIDAFSAYIPSEVGHNYTYNEDCLNLNIYTPTVNLSANLPVVVWFYGGGFGFGNNQQYDGTALAGLQDVVVVIPNYRVNLFGFLSFGSKSILPGNAGLHDQLLALRWVKKNIQNFGGNPNNVLATGESAGSIAVGIHTYSRPFRGLFHKVIYFSGTASTMIVFNKEDARKKTHDKLFEKLGITTSTNEEDILKQFQSLPSSEIVRLHGEILMEASYCQPGVDGRIIKEEPDTVLENGNFNKRIPTMIIHNDSEGMGILGMFYPGFAEGFSENMTKSILSGTFKLIKPKANFEIVYSKVKERLLKVYPHDQFFYSKLFGRVLGEIYFHFPTYMQALKQSELNNRTYVGLGSYQLRLFHDPSYSDGMPIKPDWVNCDHSDDLFITMGFPFLDGQFNKNPRLSDEEKALSLRNMQFIGNFARNSNPNEEGSNDWKSFTAADSNVMKIGLNDMTMEKDLHQEVISFWSQDFN